MNCKELRIGNFVEYEATTHVVEELHSDKVIHQWLQGAGSGYVTSYESIKGIELTPEWLEKFGFTRQLVGWAKDISLFPRKELKCIVVHLNQGVMLRSGDLEADRNDDDIVALTNTDIQGKTHVHQLQNLFFALTGRELELKK